MLLKSVQVENGITVHFHWNTQSPNRPLDYDKAGYESRTILMLGNERSGLTPNEQALCQQLVRIPMVSGIDSLNVAIAGSLLLYEVFRASR